MATIPLPVPYDQYEGWAPSAASSSSSGTSCKPSIERVPNTISRDQMWQDYVSKRKPVVIQGLLPDSDWKGHRWTDLEYLRSTAGNVPVKIEPIHPSAGHFGTSATRKTVLFSEYLDLLRDPDQMGKWYLTTQYDDDEAEAAQPAVSSSASSSQEVDHEHPCHDDSVIGALDDGQADLEPELDPVLPAPTNALSKDMPARPDLLANLVLQQCNLWLGGSKEGKSSGLHHDFHDNLYILLSGYKRFLLFPPSAHRYLHPRGQIERVHPNGLIIYTAPGQLPPFVSGAPSRLSVRPDGLVPSDAARWRRQARLRIKQEIDEIAATAAGEGKKGKHQRKGKAKQTTEQELAEQAFLQAEAELLLCKMDEEGIDPNANTSDDAEDEDDDMLSDSWGLDSDHDQDSAQMRRYLAATGLARNGGSPTEEDDDLTEDSDEADTDSFLNKLPQEAVPFAKLALAGDEAAFDRLCSFMATVNPKSDLGDVDEESEMDRNTKARVANNKASHPTSKRKRSNGSDQKQTAGASESDQDRVSLPFTKFSEEEGSSDDGSWQSFRSDQGAAATERTTTTAMTNDTNGARKKVRIVAEPGLVQHVLDEGERADDDDEDDDEDDEDADDDSDGEEDEYLDSDDSGPPLFPEADSGSEFGDVDAGEAELERLLAMSSEAGLSGDAGGDGVKAEPQSFSRIPPQTLHAHFDVLDDPSQRPEDRPLPNRLDGKVKAGKKKASATGTPALKGPRPLAGCPKPIEVFLRPGEMLYLPASWYHEVTSSSLPPFDAKADAHDSHGSSKFHMALNYWFHPPDALTFVASGTSSSSRAEPGAAAAGATNGKSESGAISVPGLAVEIGESAKENLRGGTGTCERPYRDAEVWDEVARKVYEEVKRCRDESTKWSAGALA